MVPIELAFFFKSGSPGKVSAFYPGPAGATESLLSLEAWGDIEQENPVASRKWSLKSRLFSPTA